MKELEKFNAETTPLGTELITRDGREVSEWYYFKTSIMPQPVHAFVNGQPYTFTIEGNYYATGDISANDLFIKPKVKEVWVNVYRSPNGVLFFGAILPTKEECLIQKASDTNYIKTIRITDEPE